MDDVTAAGRSIGVEEELLLVDPETGVPIGRSAEVLARAAAEPGGPPDALVQAELVDCIVEAATGRCVSLVDLREQLCHGRRRLGGAARAEGAWLVSSGLPALGGHGATASAGARFGRIAGEYAGVVGDYHACGLHVHVGVPDRDTAVAVVNHLRPWLPTLLALSANSPFRHGVDTGYASWRMIDQSRFPGAGVPPRFDSAAAYDRQVAQLVECGALVDDHMTFWFARPSSHLPTVEVRVADAVISVEEAVLQAALSRALVRTALADLARGREAPALGEQLAAAALWTAARYGLDGPGIHPVHMRRVPARWLVAELVERLTPALTETGDLSVVRQGIATLNAAGTGARRQRAAARTGPLGVLRMLASETDRHSLEAAR